MNADEHGFTAAQGDAMPRRSKATLFAILILAAIVAVQLWPGSFGVCLQLGPALLWLVSLTSVAVLSLSSDGSLSSDEEPLEPLLWLLTGGVSAALAGPAAMLSGPYAGLDWIEIAISTMFIALLYGSRHSRVYYPLAVVGQITGFVIAHRMIPVYRDGGPDESDLAAFVFHAAACTACAILLSYGAVALCEKPAPRRGTGFKALRFVDLWCFLHRLAAILTIVAVVVYSAPVCRQKIKRVHAWSCIPRVATPPEYRLLPDLIWPPQVRSIHHGGMVDTENTGNKARGTTDERG